MAYRPINIPSTANYVMAGQRAGQNVVSNLQGLSQSLDAVVAGQARNQEEFYQKGVDAYGTQLGNIEDEGALQMYQNSFMNDANLRDDTKLQLQKDVDARRSTLRNELTADFKYQNTVRDMADAPVMQELGSDLSAVVDEGGYNNLLQKATELNHAGKLSDAGLTKIRNAATGQRDVFRKEQSYQAGQSIFNNIDKLLPEDHGLSPEQFIKNAITNNPASRFLSTDDRGKAIEYAKERFEATRGLDPDQIRKLTAIEKESAGLVADLTAKYEQDKGTRMLNAGLGDDLKITSDDPSKIIADLNASGDNKWFSDGRNGNAIYASIKAATGGLPVNSSGLAEIVGIAMNDANITDVNELNASTLEAAAGKWVQGEKDKNSAYTKFLEAETTFKKNFENSVAQLQSRGANWKNEQQLIKLGRLDKPTISEKAFSEEDRLHGLRTGTFTHNGAADALAKANDAAKAKIKADAAKIAEERAKTPVAPTDDGLNLIQENQITGGNTLTGEEAAQTQIVAKEKILTDQPLTGNEYDSLDIPDQKTYLDSLSSDEQQRLLNESSGVKRNALEQGLVDIYNWVDSSRTKQQNNFKRDQLKMFMDEAQLPKSLATKLVNKTKLTLKEELLLASTLEKSGVEFYKRNGITKVRPPKE